MPAPSPLVGYNTNVRHKGKLYHIQTEDSGVNHPHVITHLFADGGRIIASRKTAYAEHLGASDLQSIVKRLMQEQHKALFIELRDCVYDDLPDARASAEALSAVAAAPRPSADAQPAAATPAPAPVDAVVAVPASPSVASAPASKPAAAQPPAVPPPAPVPMPPAAVPVEPLAPTILQPRSPPSPLGAAVAASASAHASIPAGPRTAVPVPAPRFVGTPPPMAVPTRPQYDAEALDRAAEARLVSSAIARSRVTEATRRGAGRYQQTVAARPSRAPRPPNARSVFGGEALRGKSLDEVILSYLSDDAGDSER
jgi:hypothetical protein